MRRQMILVLTVVGTTLMLASSTALTQVVYNVVECEGGDCWGTNRADQIVGIDGRDKISARTGDDLVYAGNGRDLAFGGQGADHLYGGRGEDQLHGGSGEDLVFGGAGSDELFGDAGNDNIIAADDEEADRVYCGPGKDVALVDPEDKVSDDCEIVENDGVVTPDGGEATAR